MGRGWVEDKGGGDKDGNGWDGMEWDGVKGRGLVLGGKGSGEMNLGMMIGETCSKEGFQLVDSLSLAHVSKAQEKL